MNTLVAEDADASTVTVHDVVAFLVELGTFVLLGVWAWRVAPPAVPARLLAVGLVLGLAAVLWGLFAAPRARFDRPGLGLLVKVVVLGGGVLAAYPILPVWLATCWALIVVVNTTVVTTMRLT